MTTRIIYHDFQQDSDAVYIPAESIAKGQRIAKTVSTINTALNNTCIFLCGACTAIGVLAILIASFYA